MLDHHISPIGRNDIMNIRQKANKLRLNSRASVSIPAQPKLLNDTNSTSSLSGGLSIPQDESIEISSNTTRMRHEDNSKSCEIANGKTLNSMIDTSEIHELQSPTTQMSFSLSRKTSLPSNEDLKNEDPDFGVPFRSRFSSAALVSQKQNWKGWERSSVLNPPTSNSTTIDNQGEEALHSESTGIAVKIPTSLVFERKSSQAARRSQDLTYSYETFGNHSVFSDLSEEPSFTSKERGIVRQKSGMQHRSSFSQEVSREVDGRLDLEEEEKQQLDMLYQSKQMVASDNRSYIQNDIKTVAELNTSDNLTRSGSNTSRFTSLFSNRSKFSKGVHTLHHDEFTCEGDERASRKDASVVEPIASPIRSNISRSSSGYVRWPGTLDKDGTTLSFDKSSVNEENYSVEESYLRNKRVLSPDTTSLIEVKRNDSSKMTASRSGDIIQPSIAKLKMKYKGDLVDPDDVLRSNAEIENPADFHLAAALANATSPSPPRRVYKTSITQEFPLRERGNNLNGSSHGASSSSREKTDDCFFTSEAYGQENDNQIQTSVNRGVRNAALKTTNQKTLITSKIYEKNALPSSLRRGTAQTATRKVYSSDPCPKKTENIPRALSNSRVFHRPNSARLSEKALKENERLTLGATHINGGIFKGYRGFLEKTKDVPNLIDNEIDSVTTTSTYEGGKRPVVSNIQQPETIDEESDVFDGIASFPGPSNIHNNQPYLSSYNRSLILKKNQEKKGHFVGDDAVRLGIQATPDRFNNAIISDVINRNEDHNGSLKYSSLGNVFKGDGNLNLNDRDYSSSECTEESCAHPDLNKYVIDPRAITTLVRKFRNMSKISYGRGSGRSNVRGSSSEEDSKKAFALFEMRSRIMETDIERGLERTGGTVVVDDIIITPFNLAAYCIRDAIIVSKAWRDGASPKDARTASSLMSSYTPYYLKRPVQSSVNNLSPQSSPSNGSFCSRSSHSYSLEEVLWIDDTEFSLLRCPSLGPRFMRGFEMFTIGDCQSILLKLTNDRCDELRGELNKAMSRQLSAEKALEEEHEECDESGIQSFMTDAETIYLEAMEDVKILSNDLANAEKSFHMVRRRIEKLVLKYETMLEKIDNDEDNDISLKSNSSVGHYDDYNVSENYNAEKEELSRRAHRAELKAEVAMREAQMAKIEAEKLKQETEKLRSEKQEELETLWKKLEELETKSASMASEFEIKLNDQKSYGTHISDSINSATGTQSLLYAATHVGLDEDDMKAKVRIKERFRQRNSHLRLTESVGVNGVNEVTTNKQKLTDRVNQRLEFYERSLQAVQRHSSNQ